MYFIKVCGISDHFPVLSASMICLFLCYRDFEFEFSFFPNPIFCNYEVFPFLALFPIIMWLDAAISYNEIVLV